MIRSSLCPLGHFSLAWSHMCVCMYVYIYMGIMCVYVCIAMYTVVSWKIRSLLILISGVTQQKYNAQNIFHN